MLYADHTGRAVYRGEWFCVARGLKSWVRMPLGVLRHVYVIFVLVFGLCWQRRQVRPIPRSTSIATLKQNEIQESVKKGTHASQMACSSTVCRDYSYDILAKK